MAKEILKAASAAAIEKTLQTFLPEIMNRLDSLQGQVTDLRRDLDARLTDLRKDMDTKFERTQELINDLGIRINTVDTRLDTFAEFVRRDSAKMDAWLERLVRVEEAQKSRTRKAS